MLNLSDQDLFEGAQEVESLMSRSSRLRERRETYGERFVTDKSDNELFCQPGNVNNVVKQTEAFLARAEQYSKNYLNQRLTATLLLSLIHI